MEENEHVIAYDSLDEMMTDQAKREDEANERVTPTQSAITFGDYALNISVMEHVGPVWGHIYTREEAGRLEADAYAKIGERTGSKEPWKEDGFDTLEAALKYQDDHLVEQRERGYVYGDWFSTPYPDDEIGSAHVSVLIPIPQEIYDDAKAHGGSISEANAKVCDELIGQVFAEAGIILKEQK